MHYDLARQMCRQRSGPRRFTPRRSHGLGVGLLWLRSRRFLFAKSFFEILQAHFQPGNVAVELFGRLSVALTTQGRQLNLNVLDLKPRRRQLGLDDGGLNLVCGNDRVPLRQRLAKFSNLLIGRERGHHTGF